MISDDEPIPAKAKPKRKPKKVIPVGKNGLPKRRVVKSRKTKNAKGYTGTKAFPSQNHLIRYTICLVTEDYSSYESVSESEQPVASEAEMKPKKGKKFKEEEEEEEALKPASKPRESLGKSSSSAKPTAITAKNAGGAKKGSDLMNYFKKK